MIKRTLRDAVLQNYWRFSRGMTLGVRIIAVTADGRVGLVKHGYVGGWHLPGGGVEHGETAETAAHRELVEESGAVPVGAFELLSVHANHARFPNDHVLVYRVRVGAPAPRKPDFEIQEVMWALPDALPEGATQATRARIAEAFFDAPPRGDW